MQTDMTTTKSPISLDKFPVLQCGFDTTACIKTTSCDDALPHNLHPVREFLSSKDATKRKRVNRIAKLKQCKMDARREQWLSQVNFSPSNPGNHYLSKPDGQATHDLCNEEKQAASARAKAGAVVVSEKSGQHRGEKDSRQGCGTDQESLPSDSICTSSSSVLTEDNDSPFILETEDDWEVAADALCLPVSSSVKVTSKLLHTSEGKDFVEKKPKVPGSSHPQNDVLKPGYKGKTLEKSFKTKGVEGHAWRSDDASRPPTLPCLSKQRNFLLESSTSVWAGVQQGLHLWGSLPVPSYCPICTEELDVTDSSFFPCSCGFRLCLFCHHRISSDDGRCPGCRKAYSPDVAMKLSRTTTFWLRL